MTTKHTPGPWKLKLGKFLEHDYLVGNYKYQFACFSHNPQMAKKETKANARLIAAAPELLEALIAVVRVADRKTNEFDLAHAAIAKATGETL